MALASLGQVRLPAQPSAKWILLGFNGWQKLRLEPTQTKDGGLDEASVIKKSKKREECLESQTHGALYSILSLPPKPNSMEMTPGRVST